MPEVSQYFQNFGWQATSKENCNYFAPVSYEQWRKTPWKHKKAIVNE